MLAWALSHQGEFAEAEAGSREAIRFQPDHSWALSELGAALLEQGKLDDAVTEFRQAFRLPPDLDWEAAWLCKALDRQRRYAEMVAAYQEAVRLRPGVAGQFLDILKRRGQFDGATVDLREAVRSRSDDPHAHTGLALALLERDETDEAVVEFRKVAMLRPDDPCPCARLALALCVRGSRRTRWPRSASGNCRVPRARGPAWNSPQSSDRSAMPWREWAGSPKRSPSMRRWRSSERTPLWPTKDVPSRWRGRMIWMRR